VAETLQVKILMKAVFPSFLSHYLVEVAPGAANEGKQQFKGQDQQASLQLQLKDRLLTHQQTFNINGKNIRITIPAGAEDGQVIRLKGYGEAGSNGGPAGDLYIRFDILDDAKFKRSGNDLYTTVILTSTQQY
jgi:curved DNA-binding protein